MPPPSSEIRNGCPGWIPAPCLAIAVVAAAATSGDAIGDPGAVSPAPEKPPLPAGVSASEVYWCDKCRVYHRKDDHAAPAPGPKPD